MQHISPIRLCPSTHFTASYFRMQQSSGYCSTLLSLSCPLSNFWYFIWYCSILRSLPCPLSTFCYFIWYCSILRSLPCPLSTFCKQFLCPHFHATPAEKDRSFSRCYSPVVKMHCLACRPLAMLTSLNVQLLCS
jgi:hypothetical protein